MLLDFIDKRIRRAFSDAAYEYDLLTSLHKEIGRELIKKVVVGGAQCAPLQEPEAILDIGMGTGWLTGKLHFYFPESKVVGIDFAEEMLKVARDKYEDIKIIQANAMNLPFREATFDLIVSNLSLQWVKELEACFKSARRALKNDGKIYFTMFGQETFRELFIALEHANNLQKGNAPLDIRRLHSKEAVELFLKSAGFKEVVIDYETIKVHFSDMYRLIKWIKDIGANGLPKQMFIGKELLQLADEYYEKNYKDKFGITATFEVIWAQAEK